MLRISGKSADLLADEILETPVSFSAVKNKMMSANLMTFRTPVTNFHINGVGDVTDISS